MLHLDDGLELLDVASVSSVGVVRHMISSQKSSLHLDVVDDVDLFVALETFLSTEGVVDDRAVEP